MPGLATLPYYARPLASIMPGQTWRDTGHKAALRPVSRVVEKKGVLAQNESKPAQLKIDQI